MDLYSVLHNPFNQIGMVFVSIQAVQQDKQRENRIHSIIS